MAASKYRSVVHDPDHLHHRRDRPPEAIGAYRKALELQPAFPMARNNLDAAQRQVDLKKAGKAPQPEPAAGK